jgi:hypothetical protein
MPRLEADTWMPIDASLATARSWSVTSTRRSSRVGWPNQALSTCTGPNESAGASNLQWLQWLQYSNGMQQERLMGMLQDASSNINMCILECNNIMPWRLGNTERMEDKSGMDGPDPFNLWKIMQNPSKSHRILYNDNKHNVFIIRTYSIDIKT